MKYLIPQGVFLLNDPNGVLEAQLPANIRIMRNKKLKRELSRTQSCVALDPECHFSNIRALRLLKKKKVAKDTKYLEHAKEFRQQCAP